MGICGRDDSGDGFDCDGFDGDGFDDDGSGVEFAAETTKKKMKSSHLPSGFASAEMNHSHAYLM